MYFGSDGEQSPKLADLAAAPQLASLLTTRTPRHVGSQGCHLFKTGYFHFAHHWFQIFVPFTTTPLDQLTCQLGQPCTSGTISSFSAQAALRTFLRGPPSVSSPTGTSPASQSVAACQMQGLAFASMLGKCPKLLAKSIDKRTFR